MSKYNINEMNLYKTTNRFLKSFIELKKSLNRLPTILELSAIDHLHYNGAEAVEYAIKKINIDSHSNVLDIGSGIGGPARYIANNTHATVYAVEIQKELNEIGQILTNEYNLKDKVKHIQQDILKFAMKNKKFDSVVSWLALYHIPNRKKLFKKIFSVLKPKGYFYSEDFFLIDKLNKIDKSNLSKSFHANYLVNYKQYLKDLEAQKFIIISHNNMSINWSNFTKKRLQNYKKNFNKNAIIYGVNASENVLKFYELAHNLLSSKKIGGISFLAKKLST